MSRKDYIRLAEALRDAMPTGDQASTDAMVQWIRDCKSIASSLAEDNARFSRQRFLDACGVKSPAPFIY